MPESNDPCATAALLPGPVVEAALQPYTDNPRHAAIAVMNALRHTGFHTIPPGTAPPKITAEVWDGADQHPYAKVVDVVRIDDTWHVVVTLDD